MFDQVTMGHTNVYRYFYIYIWKGLREASLDRYVKVFRSTPKYIRYNKQTGTNIDKLNVSYCK